MTEKEYKNRIAQLEEYIRLIAESGHYAHRSWIVGVAKEALEGN